ncbi:MAG: hypothetical protein QOF59_1238 [Actinomycetota bacterium]|jgi:hypothetical protein|nr:hypothetical protein [Actinomycetota bacterium]MDQ1475313.1 hypothetical protein [Actinomycetota bacterium]
MITFLLVGTVVVNLVVLWLQVRRRRQIVAATHDMDRASLVLIETAQNAIEATGTQIVVPSES